MFLDELNPSQREAVLCCDAPSLVIAGAGSGKTRVLTYKIAYLLEQGMEPWRILALTFTNKAAREMQQRISRQVGAERASGLWMGTFHSVFSRILRYECSSVGFSSDFTIYDATDSKNMVRTIIREMGLDEKQYKASTVAAQISNAKNSLILPSAFRNSSEMHRRCESMNMRELPAIYDRYFERGQRANVMDFDDLLLYTWILLKEHPDVAQRYQEKFQFVLVDEYQDTNYAQHQIVWLLTNLRQRVCVVGDDAQSIYSFRGANIDNILNFQKMYVDAKLFKLEQNYRSTQNIVGAANSLIHHNQRQIHKDVFSRNDVGSPIEVCQAYSDIDEANIVVRKIRNFNRREGLKFSQIAVLYRTNAQSRSLEEALRKDNIPYRIYGGISFYQRKEIKDVIAYFRLAVNPSDEEALRRVINYPTRGIGDTTLEKVFAKANEMSISPWEVMQHPESLPVNKGTVSKLQNFVSLIQSFHEASNDSDAYELGIRIVRESGIQGEIYHGKDPDDISKQENLQELVDGMSSFVEERTEQGEGTSLSHYLQEVSLLSDMDEDESEGDDKVTLMTVHSAKGLEFGAVIVVGMEESLFPSQMSMENPRQIEEERRLFYVAMTRAEKYLILTYAKSRIRYGKMEFSNPSRFLQDIDPGFLKSSANQSSALGNNPFSRPTSRNTGYGESRFSPSGYSPSSSQPSNPFSAKKVSSYREERPSFSAVNPPSRFVRLRPTASSSSAPPSVPSGIFVGTKISHERFGVGTIEKIEGAGMDAKATVNFENAGRKQLLLRFAKFQVIG